VGRRDRRVERLQAQIGRLKGELAAAKERIAELEAKLRQNSSNTSRPPSSDGPGNKPKRDRPKGKAKRKRGGQPGHAKHERPLVPVECVQKVIDLKPEVCGKCDKRLEGEDPEPHRHQVWELPEITPEITEYREHSRLCDCGHTTRGTLPPGVPAGAFGPRAMAFIAMLTGRFRISKREAAELCAEGLGLPICAGSVSKVEQTVSEAIAAPVDEAREHVREQRQANIDETGWKEGNKKAWLWAAATMFVAVFTVDLSRGSSVAKQILGDSWNGVINSDRWSAVAFHAQ
jgi:transposase